MFEQAGESHAPIRAYPAEIRQRPDFRTTSVSAPVPMIRLRKCLGHINGWTTKQSTSGEDTLVLELLSFTRGLVSWRTNMVLVFGVRIEPSGN